MILDFVRRNQILVGAIAALLIVNLAVLLFFTLPKLDTEAYNRQRVEAVEKQHNELQRILNERRQFQQLLASNVQALNNFYKNILGRRENRITEILAEREDISGQFGISPTQVRYSFVDEQNMPLERFRMSFPLEGSYESFRFFVNTLENSENFFIIDDIELASQADETEIMNMRIEVTTFFYDPEAGSQDVDEEDLADE